jgi:hypothetical protein
VSDELHNKIHKEKQRIYLSEEEQRLPEFEREKLLIERELVDKGILREQDLVLANNKDFIQAAARDSQSKLNGGDKTSFKEKIMRISVWLFSPVMLLIFLKYPDEVAHLSEQFELLPYYFEVPIKIIAVSIFGFLSLASLFFIGVIHKMVAEELNDYCAPEKVPEKIINAVTFVLFFFWSLPAILLAY